MKKLAIACVLLAALAACAPQRSGKSPAPNQSPKSQLGDAYDQEIQADDRSEIRVEVRAQVMKYLKDTHPNWQVKGLSLTHYDNDANYYVGADIFDGKVASVVQIKVWSFIDDEGKTYRKIVEVRDQ